MNVEMDESGAGHGRFWGFRHRGGSDRQAKPDSPRNGDASNQRSPRGTRHCRALSGLSPGDWTPKGQTCRFLPQNWGISCAQTAIIPTNSVIDASAAASSTKILNMLASLRLEHKGNSVPFLFHESRGGSG